jgi:biotin operon repressor
MSKDLLKTVRYLCIVTTLLTVGVWVSIAQRFVEPKAAMAQTKKPKYDLYCHNQNTDEVLPCENAPAYLAMGQNEVWKAIKHANKNGIKIHSIINQGDYKSNMVVIEK